MAKKTTIKNPRISFVCPCYNDSKEIGRFVESIIDQDFESWEMVIVNDGSTDNSKAIVDALAESDRRIRAIHLETNQGACVARNLGAKEAKGDYLSFLPADAFLYPGMLRIWVEQLDEYPEYDFLYGGYRITDENHEPIQGGELLFHNFDPYLLEVTNYIDGSFPIRTKAFWEVSELMNKLGKQTSEGLWDPAIKSLQDWDFWLSVVIEGKRRGIYIQDIFFETTAPHPGGLSYDSANNWLARSDQIKAKHDIAIRRLCVHSLGAAYHAKKMAYILNADFHEMPSRRQHHYDAIYSIGFYPQFAKQQDAAFLNNYYDDKGGRNPCKKIIHFVGTDIWQLRSVSLNGLDVWKGYVRNAVDEVLVEADFTRDELKEILGIEAKIVPLPPGKLFPILPFPEKFTVAVYAPGINTGFYNLPLMEEVAKALPEVDFKFFGNPLQLGKHKDIKNIEYVGYVNDMESFIKECSAIIRFPIHDGLPISVLEFVLAGRYAALNVPVKNTFFVPNSDLKSIVAALNQIQDKLKQGPNQEGSDYWRGELDHDKFRARIKEITGYDPKEYWEKRAASWDIQAKNSSVEEAEIEEFYKEVNPTSVLDLGCGNGRWIPILEKWGLKLENYLGVDISGKLIEFCQKTFPNLKFFMESVEKLTLPDKYDLVFCYTTLEHVKEEDIEKAVANIKALGKKLLLIEPVGFESRYYCRSHDYPKHFKVIKEKKLKDKTVYLIDLE